MEEKEIKKLVRQGYAEIANQGNSCCASSSSCCGGPQLAWDISRSLGYADDDLEAAPAGSNLGLGCGNPVALACLEEGETVLDLGCGAGFDCFLAARRVGERGRVIGVDMTPEMICQARENARRGGYFNVEFHLGEIENLPLDDNLVDVVISNCVINLSSDKARVFREAFRVLKPGGRLMISDTVLLRELPDYIKNEPLAYVGCLAGAIMKEEYLGLVKKAGFQNVEVIEETPFAPGYVEGMGVAEAAIKDLGSIPQGAEEAACPVWSIKVKGIKPLLATES